MDGPSLEQIQRWMQAVITHPLGVEAGLASPEAQQAIPAPLEELETVVERSRQCTSLERLDVYARSYYARLLECLREFFPALAYALGEKLFDQFAFGYLQRYPSRSYTLNRLADHFVQFLEETRPRPEADVRETPERETPEPETDAREDAAFDRWAGFLIELARLEWSIDAVFDGPGWEREPPLSPAELEALPAERWPEARLVPAVCLRLLAFRFPVNDYFTAFLAGERPEVPQPADTWLALTRRDYVVRRIPLSAPQFALLSALSSGETVGEAIAAAAGRSDDLDRLADELGQWFRDWAAAGLFRRVELP